MKTLFRPAFLAIFAIFAVTLFPAASPAQDRKAPEIKDADEAAVVERTSDRVHFENDGTGYSESSAVIHIQSEAGVEEYGQLVFGYSSATEKLEVVYVRVRKPNGQVIETPHANEQDFAPDALESAPMYSDYRQRHVTVVNLRPGDTLEYSTKTTTFTPLAKGNFWYEFSFPKYRVTNEVRLQIEVPKSREVKLKSPKRNYTTADQDDWRTYTWEVKNIVPERPKRDAEDADDDDNAKDEFPEIQMTTFPDWKSVASWYAALQGERVVVDPALRQKAAELTRGAATPTEKAQRLYDFVARDFRYVSLSFGVGRYQPHASTEVLQAGYGDCKDKHTLLAAMLQAVNIQSYPVLISYGRKLDPDVPSPAQFNHVITAARLGKDDKDLTWLDATAEVAPFGLIMYPLRDKDAVLASATPIGGLVHTPIDSPVKNRLSYSMEGKVSATGTLDSTVDMVARGDYEIPFRVAFRSNSQSDWPRLVKALLTNEGMDVSDVKVEPLEDTTKPIHVHFRAQVEHAFRVPSSGEPYFPFMAMPVPSVNKPEKGAKTVRMGPTGEFTQKLHLQFPSNFKMRVPPTVSFKRDYGEYTANFDFANGVLSADRTLVLKMNELPLARRSEGESLRSLALNRSAQIVSLTATPVAQHAATALAEASKESPEEARSAGIKALQQHDYRTASALLKKATEAAQGDKAPWYELGRAYAALNEHDQAVAAFRKQIELNSRHKTAYDDLGAELVALGKYDEAVSAYKKQLDTLPLDKVAHKRLGLLLAGMKRDNDAISELEAFASVPPADPQVSFALATLYARNGKADKARAIFTELLGTATVTPSTDVFSTALRDDIKAEDTIRDAAQVLSDIGDQFDSGSYATDSRDALAAMPFVALSWARIGWAHSLKSEKLDAIRYLQAAFDLTLSPVVANRLGRVYEGAGDNTNAKHFYALAVALGGAEVEDSRARLKHLAPTAADELIKKSSAELAALRAVKLARISATEKGAAPSLNLVFDGSGKPERVDSYGADVHSAEQAILNASFPVIFPEQSSVKVVREGALVCRDSGCSIELKSAGFNPDALNPNATVTASNPTAPNAGASK